MNFEMVDGMDNMDGSGRLGRKAQLLAAVKRSWSINNYKTRKNKKKSKQPNAPRGEDSNSKRASKNNDREHGPIDRNTSFVFTGSIDGRVDLDWFDQSDVLDQWIDGMGRRDLMEGPTCTNQKHSAHSAKMAISP